ncbi:hypothetical protein MANES_S018967v8 [Manihot esculenta]|uniref:Uncharacterized protein n=1 Tax=Manihot esculenta TaxID=3983 RepID=A0ACB7FUL2_MANES|nr:hypothetical protein MANES_S018967v8 [Manihot esculenta]
MILHTSPHKPFDIHPHVMPKELSSKHCHHFPHTWTATNHEVMIPPHDLLPQLAPFRHKDAATPRLNEPIIDHELPCYTVASQPHQLFGLPITHRCLLDAPQQGRLWTHRVDSHPYSLLLVIMPFAFPRWQ